VRAKLVCVLMILGISHSCRKTEHPPAAAIEPALPTLSTTHWGVRTELFMEYPELVKGEKASFAVHLTDLISYRPLAEAVVTLELQKGGKPMLFSGNKPSRPGIFRVDALMDSAGTYKAALKVKAPEFDDRHDLGEMIVYESKAAAIEHPVKAATPVELIRFLKEQQWSSEFATEVAAPRKIEESLQVPAIVRPRGGGEGSAISPVRGRLSPLHKLPVPGQPVQEGDILATVIPFTASPQDMAGLKLELSQAETDLAQSRQVRERLDGLLADRAIPARRVDEAKAEEKKAQARVNAARERLAQFEQSRSSLGVEDSHGQWFEVRAPLGGIVTKLSVVTGGSVEAGQEILRITDFDRVWVIAEVPESEFGILQNLKRAQLETTEERIVIPGKHGKIQQIGNVVDPDSRRIPVIFEIANQNRILRIGQSLIARLSKGRVQELVSVPVSALVDDAGRPVVFIQYEGEGFERRPVRTGAGSGEYVQITQGIQSGERVVSRGAYLIRLAALSTQIPAHGHVH
jgi:membrane fusion protein, heavy metal efflux system